MNSINLLDYPICFAQPLRLDNTSAWIEHVPFGMFMIDLLRPNVLVELGTHTGVSYSAFCQAVQQLGLETRCYAVDTWEGDAHAGYYGASVLADLRAYHDPLYGEFSRLLQITFDNAVEYFLDGSIDLLHIDGLHTYEAVKHDFQTWLPKLSERGVVLFHDTNVHERDFGVWKFWAELKQQFPYFEFVHGHGLGVLRVGEPSTPAREPLFSMTGDQSNRVKDFFFTLGSRLSAGVKHDSNMGERDGQIASLKEAVAERDRHVEGLNHELAERDRQIAGLNQAVAERDGQIAILKRAVAGRDGQIAGLTHAVAERDGQIVRLTKALAKRDRRITTLNKAAAECDPLRRELQAIRYSTSWRLTAPLRFVKRGASSLIRRAQRVGTPRRPQTDRVVVPARRPRRILRALLGLSRMLGDTLRSPPEIGRKLRKLVRTFTQGGLYAVLSELRNAVVYRTAPHVTAHLSAPRRTALPEVIALSEVPVNSTNSDLPVPGISIDALRAGPTISIVMPVYEIDPALFEKAVRSVLRQSYPNWELCIVDDASKRSDLKDRLTDIVALDDRIRLVQRSENGGISIASNDALAVAAGDFVAFLDNDDELAPHALLHVAAVLDCDPSIDVVYSDEDKLDEHGMHCEPFRKPDWSPEYLRGVMYVGHLLVIRRAIVKEIGGFDARYDGAQDFELMLRVSERTDRIAHLPVILYHWRKNPGSVAATSTAKPYIQDKQVAAVNAHLDRLAIKRRAVAHPTLPHRVIVTAQSRDEWPTVSIIVPTKDQPRLIERCLETIFATTTYQNFQVVVVDNATSDPSALTILEDFEARHPKRFIRVQFDRTFNFSTANNLGATYATGKYLLLLNNDTEIVQSDWLQELVALAEEPGVGAVGALLVYPNGTIQHAGVALGLRGTADHICRGFRPETDGYAGSIVCSREVSAVTAACLLLSSVLYREIGGFREGYKTHYQDVDLCLRIRARKLRILYTPRARVVHHESGSRAAYYDLVDRALLIDTWRHTLTIADPYCSPLVKAFGYAPPPRA